MRDAAPPAGSHLRALYQDPRVDAERVADETQDQDRADPQPSGHTPAPALAATVFHVS